MPEIEIIDISPTQWAEFSMGLLRGEPGPPGITWRENFTTAAGTEYNENDVVLYNGGLWIAVADFVVSPDTVPQIGSEYWDLFMPPNDGTQLQLSSANW